VSNIKAEKMVTVNSTQEEAEKTSQQGYLFQGQDSMLQFYIMVIYMFNSS
jgi:hypothetical protein